MFRSDSASNDCRDAFGGDPVAYIPGYRTPAPPVSRWRQRPLVPQHVGATKCVVRRVGPTAPPAAAGSATNTAGQRRAISDDVLSAPVGAVADFDVFAERSTNSADHDELWEGRRLSRARDATKLTVPSGADVADAAHERAVLLGAALRCIHSAASPFPYARYHNATGSSTTLHVPQQPSTTPATDAARGGNSSASSSTRRWKRADLTPTAAMIQAAVEQKKEELLQKPTFCRRQLNGIPALPNAAHDALLKAIEIDDMCVKQKLNIERQLAQRAKIQLQREHERAKPKRPTSARIQRDGAQEACTTSARSSVQEKVASLTPRQQQQVLYPSYFLPQSRRYIQAKTIQIKLPS